jgi:phosphoheptose isomerase
LRESEFVTATLAETIALHERVKHGDLGPVTAAAAAIIEALGHDGSLLTFGNGGSAADAQHVASELVGRFLRERRS